MNIETKYNIGDTFYQIAKVYKRIPCPCCDGSGRLKGRDGTKVQCPKYCSGGMIKGNESSAKWEVKGKVVIAGFKIQQDYWTSGVCKEFYSDSMGEYFDFNHLFPTREEAVAACEKLNAETKQ